MQTPHGLPPSPSRSSSASGPRSGLTGPVAARRFRSIERKLIVPLALVFGAVALGVAIAWLLLRTRLPGRRWLDWGASAALAIPGIVLAAYLVADRRSANGAFAFEDAPPACAAAVADDHGLHAGAVERHLDVVVTRLL
mgnify:CR=1 FL=1